MLNHYFYTDLIHFEFKRLYANLKEQLLNFIKIIYDRILKRAEDLGFLKRARIKANIFSIIN